MSARMFFLFKFFNNDIFESIISFINIERQALSPDMSFIILSPITEEQTKTHFLKT